MEKQVLKASFFGQGGGAGKSDVSLSPLNSPSFYKTFLAKIKGHAWIDIKENALWYDDFRRKPSHYLFGSPLP